MPGAQEIGRPDTGTAGAIFAAAAQEFAERGFDAAGVDRIAARAGVNKAMLYYHFGSKKSLYTEVLRDMFRAVGVRARAIADGPGPAGGQAGRLDRAPSSSRRPRGRGSRPSCCASSRRARRGSTPTPSR